MCNTPAAPVRSICNSLRDSDQGCLVAMSVMVCKPVSGDGKAIDSPCAVCGGTDRDLLICCWHNRQKIYKWRDSSSGNSILYFLLLQGTIITKMAYVESNLHKTVLQIYSATFLPNTINIGQNLTNLLQKLQVAVFCGTHCRFLTTFKLSVG